MNDEILHNESDSAADQAPRETKLNSEENENVRRIKEALVKFIESMKKVVDLAQKAQGDQKEDTLNLISSQQYETITSALQWLFDTVEQSKDNYGKIDGAVNEIYDYFRGLDNEARRRSIDLSFNPKYQNYEALDVKEEQLNSLAEAFNRLRDLHEAVERMRPTLRDLMPELHQEMTNAWEKTPAGAARREERLLAERKERWRDFEVLIKRFVQEKGGIEQAFNDIKANFAKELGRIAQSEDSSVELQYVLELIRSSAESAQIELIMKNNSELSKEQANEEWAKRGSEFLDWVIQTFVATLR